MLPHDAAVRTIRLEPARGLRKEIEFRDQLQMYLDVFEIEPASWFQRFCQPGTNAFDVGAREGYVTLLAKLSAGGRVLGFEAGAGEHERLRRNIAVRDGHNRWLVAVGR